MPIVLLEVFDGHQYCHYFNHCDTLILDWYVYQNICCYRKFSIQQGPAKNHSSIREGKLCVDTNNTGHPQLNILRCNKLLSLCKLHRHSSSVFLSCAESSFNSMYTPLTLSFYSTISESRVSGMDNKISVCDNKVVRKLKFPPQFIQIQRT